MKIVIIIPTYNERENITRLIPEVLHHVRSLAHDEVEILVVDDQSPDQTAEAVREMMADVANLRLITGKKEGLGRAYLRGMTHAMEVLEADVVMEMDADFSHKPEDIPRLLAGLDRHDFVIGSRYVPGGNIPNNWSLLRKMNSRFGNIFARHVAGLSSVKDCTAGFRAIKTSVLKKINLNKLKAKGYCFQISLLHAAKGVGARIHEVAVDFVDRTAGESKLGLKDILEFMFFVWIIRLQNSKTFIRFALVGISGVVVNVGVMTILLRLGINKFIASPVAIQVSIMSNFFLNNYWTFRHRSRTEHLTLRGLKFNLVSLVSLIVSFTAFVLLSICFPQMAPQWHQAISVIPVTFVNYFLNSYWTFRSGPTVS